ncbi:hypothetical protein QE152_g8643 [Popillia japonica]|uniref:Uncharacterized protein n=1 Tax=Popillia japonica TaxID=7064 RepID=A0AAW1LXC7_POPJA
MFEVEERRRREKNLVIFNLEDTNSRDNDIKAAKEVIHFLNPNINIPSETECHRLGRDLTPRELDAKNRVLSDFRARRDKGENVFLKYLFSIPRIMQKN